MSCKIKLISEIGVSSNKALLIRLPEPMLAKIPISDQGDVDAVELARVLLAPPSSDESEEFGGGVDLMRLIFDSSIAVGK